MEQEQYLIVTKETLQHLMTYLFTRPYGEVAGLVDRLRQSKTGTVDGNATDSGTDS
jgi:hypothetical protein